MTSRCSCKLLEAALLRCCAEAGESLGEVCRHALAGGGRTRATLLLQASERTDGVALKGACALEMMHAATLLQDDIFDRSAARRGRKAAYLAFGEARAVLASDWLLLHALELAAEVDTGFFRQLACAAKRMAVTVATELEPPALSGLAAAEAYVSEICQGKTAALFAASLFGAAVLHGAAEPTDASAWAGVGRGLGGAYQLLDDCLDVYAPADVVNKSTGVDLEQGRLTLPLLTALRGLQSAGQGVSVDSFRERQLTGAEMGQIEQALAEDVVRTEIEEEAGRQVRSFARSAVLAGIPRAAIDAVLIDMEEKLVVCFGARERFASRARFA